jgi:osmotically inducible lipoprotein OsmB
MQFTKWIAGAVCAITLAACGDTPLEQGLIGAGAGAGAAVVLDGNPVTGAVVGGAANVVYCQRYPSRC